MRHYPVFLDLRDRRVVVAGAGPVAVAKLRLLLKTEAALAVYGVDPSDEVLAWAAERRIALAERDVEAADVAGAALVYGATGRRGRGCAGGGDRPGGRGAGQPGRQSRGQRLHHAGDRRPRPGDGGDRHRGCGAGAGAQDQGRGRGDAAGDARPADPDRAGVPPPGRGAGFADRGGRSGRGSISSAGPRAMEAGEDAAREALEEMLAEGVAPRRGVVHLVGTGPAIPN